VVVYKTLKAHERPAESVRISMLGCINEPDTGATEVGQGRGSGCDMGRHYMPFYT
jgi:hypothetical protein